MGRYIVTTSGREAVMGLLEKLADYVTDLEELQDNLSNYAEDYMEDMEDLLNQAGQQLQATSREHRLNRMLLRELNASRKEVLSLLKQMADHDIQPQEGTHIHHRRLNPDLYGQDPETPFYFQDPDEHYNFLLAGQLNALVRFEEYTPMTTAEREALRDYVISKTGFDSDTENDWEMFLDGLRSEGSIAVQERR